MSEQQAALCEILDRVRQETAKVIIGQDEAINLALITILAGNHALIEGVPGIAKTLLVRTIARVLGSPFSRIQFTPDLMPSDITGTNVFNLQTHSFTLHKGPVFTTFLLADEINRAPAKTQSALLQAMQERSVSIDLETHALPRGFTVFATQNPVEYEGTYPLPEAQKDRFMFKINMGFPEREQELELGKRMLAGESPESVLERGGVEQKLSEEDLLHVQGMLSEVTVREEIAAYAVDVVRRTRAVESVAVGAGPRAVQALLLGTRANAAIAGRDFVGPDDVKALAGPVLEHRIILRPEFEMEGVTAREVVAGLLTETPVPR